MLIVLKNRGFSLLETSVVLAALGIMIGLSLPLYRGYLTDRELQNAAHLIQGDLRLAQQTAVGRSGSGPRVELCFRSTGYDIYAVDYVGNPVARTGAQMGQTIKVANAGQEYASALTVTVDPTASDPCLLNGSRRAIVFAGSAVPISFDDATSKDITLTFRGRTYRVTIAPVTGRVTVGR